MPSSTRRQFRRPPVAAGAAPAPVRTTASPWPCLALGRRDEREDPVAQGDADVVPLSHADQQRVGAAGWTGKPSVWVTVIAVAAEGDPERGVGAGVDQPDPDPLPGLAR